MSTSSNSSVSTFEKTQKKNEERLSRNQKLEEMEKTVIFGWGMDELAGPPTLNQIESELLSDAGVEQGNDGSSHLEKSSHSIPESAIERARNFLWDDGDDTDNESRRSFGGAASMSMADADTFAGVHRKEVRSNFLNKLFIAVPAFLSSPKNTEVESLNSGRFNNMAPRGAAAANFSSSYNSEDDVLSCRDEDLTELSEINKGSCLKKRYLKPLLVVLLALLIITILSVSASKKKNNDAEVSFNGPDNVFVPHKPNDLERYSEIRDFIVESEFTSAEHLDIFDTPQYNALVWLTDDDKANLEVEHAAFLQRYALAVLYFSTYLDENNGFDRSENGAISLIGRYAPGKSVWDVSDNWMSDKGICMWYGVECDMQAADGGQYSSQYNENANVFHLNLKSNSLWGTIPSEIAALENLVTLNLGKNGLIGSIPTTVGLLSNLVKISLSDNKLIGSIPKEVGMLEQVEDIWFGINKLSGVLPEEELGNLSNLHALSIRMNEFTGQLPDSFSDSLEVLLVDDNQFSGTIHSELGALANLRKVQFQNNNFTGEMPSTICNGSETKFDYVSADCSGEVEVACPCCNKCF